MDRADPTNGSGVRASRALSDQDLPSGNLEESLRSKASTSSGSDQVNPIWEVGSELSKSEKPKSAARENKRKAASLRVLRPANWKPNEQHEQKASVLGLDLKYELENFILHNDACAGRYADWDSAFHTWMRKSVEFRPRNGKPPGLVEHELHRPMSKQAQRLLNEAKAAAAARESRRHGVG